MGVRGGVEGLVVGDDLADFGSQRKKRLGLKRVSGPPGSRWRWDQLRPGGAWWSDLGEWAVCLGRGRMGGVSSIRMLI
jgi:hypothetical protein